MRFICIIRSCLIDPSLFSSKAKVITFYYSTQLLFLSNLLYDLSITICDCSRIIYVLSNRICKPYRSFFNLLFFNNFTCCSSKGIC